MKNTRYCIFLRPTKPAGLPLHVSLISFDSNFQVVTPHSHCTVRWRYMLYEPLPRALPSGVSPPCSPPVYLRRHTQVLWPHFSVTSALGSLLSHSFVDNVPQHITSHSQNAYYRTALTTPLHTCVSQLTLDQIPYDVHP
jgi:hypothetical protein